MRSESEVNRAIERYVDTVNRICILHLKNRADTEDIFQAVFLKYALHTAAFESDAHEKAWLIRVTINACKDLLRSFFYSRTVSLHALGEAPDPAAPPANDLRDALPRLPEKYRRPLYLHYYEGYTAAEIGEVLGKKENTVYTLLNRGRKLLRKELGGDEGEG